MRQRLGKLFTLLAVLIMVAGYSTSADAVLKSVGPLNFAGFPAYYQDINNLAVQPCLSQAISPVTGLPICAMLAFPNTVPPFNPTLPVTFPPNPPTGFNFPLESFYLSAQPPPAFKFATPGAGRLVLLTNLEGTFANNLNPVPGDQITFSRIRIWLLGAPTGRYKITHPFGVDFMDVIQADIKTQKLTRDIGVAGIQFQGALKGDIGPFLKWTPDPALIAAGTQNADGTIPATNPLTGAAEVYLGDPNIIHTFTGSPFGTNFWRIDGPPGSGIGGVDALGNPIDFIQSNEAVIIGQKYTAPIPSPLTADRATYARAGVAGSMDIFATTSPTSNAAVPTPSALSVSGTGITTTAMTGNAAGNFFAHIPTATPNLIPPTITITNTADVPPSAITANLVDEVTISKAIYNIINQTLSIQAASADKFLNPALTAVGLGPLDPATGSLNLVTAVPPPSVTVQSAARGTATLPITTAINLVPVANPDAATTASGAATSIFVTANDTDIDGFINPATVTIVTPPANGTAVALLNGTVNYSPNPGYVSPAGVPDTFTYTVQDNLGAVSNAATVSVTVTAAVPPPVATADVAITQVGTPVIVNVIANDTAPGGFINPSTVNVVSGPLNGTAVANANGTVTYTPNPGFIGTNTFSYVVSNNLNTLSNVATVTVTVTALNAVPSAVNDSASTASGISVKINVLANDTPLAALNPASVLIVTAPLNGTAVANADGTVTYSPALGFTGTNTFTYSVRDSFGTVSNAATVTVTVASNVPPVANSDVAVTPSGVAATINVLANDVASVGNTLTPGSVAIVAAPPALQGTAAVNPATGAITFTPAVGFTGPSSFTYTVTDSRLAVSNVATVNVTVTSSPLANNDTVATPAGVPVIINVLANDTAALGNSLNPASVAIATSPLVAEGTVNVNATTGAITFTPAAAFTGASTFTYTVNDNLGAASAPATVTVTVTAATTPVAGNDAAATPVNVPVIINVLANDAAAAGNTLDPTSVTIGTSPPPAEGGLSVNAATGAVTFTPAAAFTGTSSFTYTVKDTLLNVSNIATVTVNVAALPTANADTATTTGVNPVTINVLANDTAAPGNSLVPSSVTVATAPAVAQGSTAVNTTTGAITFTPAATFTGTSFTYTVQDNLGAISAQATVTVNAASVPPVANNDTATATAAGPAITINVLANDIPAPGNTLNPASVTITGLAAAQGLASITPATGIITFTPAATFTGTSFTYTVNDNLGVTSNAAIVTVSPTPVAVPPVANNDTATAQTAISTLFSVVANDTSAVSSINPATVTIVTPPLHGTAVANVSGIVTYTSAAAYVGADSFTYTVKDLLGVTSNIATVGITVSAPTAPPSAVADTATTTAGIAVNVSVLTNDTAAGGINPTSIFIITQPLHGTAVAQPNGTVAYTPAAGYISPVGVPDTFTYTFRDNLGVVSNSATVSVTVNPATTLVAPTATNDTASTNKNAPVTINVLANDSAAPGNTLAPATVFVVSQPLNGTAAADALGVVTFTPALNFTGTTTFAYNVKDTLGATSNTATVTVTVLPVNIAPVALNATASVLNGGAAGNPSVVIPIGALVSDIDGTVNFATGIAFATTAATHGTVTYNAVTKAFTYTPAVGYTSPAGTPATFTYTALDNVGAISNVATVSITVNAPAAETLAITRSQFQLAGSNWRVDGTTTARVLGETVQIYNTPAAPNPCIGVPGFMTANVDVNGVWTQVAKGSLIAPNVQRQVSICTSLGNVLNNIPVVLR